MMMERRRALTIPFTLPKDNRMENPLKIPKACLPPEIEKLQKRVPWTAFSDCKWSHENLPPKNGFDCSRAAMIKLEMTRRAPLLVLRDVLKTKLGRDYMERIKRGPSWSTRSSVTQSRRASANADLRSLASNINTSSKNGRAGRHRRCKSETRQSRRWTASTPTKTPPTTVKRKNVNLRKSYKEEETDDGESSEEVLMDKNNQEDEDFAEVVDCELLVSCEPAEDAEDCEKFNSQSRLKNKWTESEKDPKHSLRSEGSQKKRKRKDPKSHCNGTVSPKRRCQSVLRLSGDDTQVDVGPLRESDPAEQIEENLESLDPCIVQFTVGGDDHTEFSLSLINSQSEANDEEERSQVGVESSQENTTKHSEPIVLSSDEEETRCSSQVVKLGESVFRGVSPQRPKLQQAPAPAPKHTEVARVAAVPHLPALPSLSDSDYSTIRVPFSSLYCGGHQGKANGFLLILNQEILLPLKSKDKRGYKRCVIRLSSTELRKYSIWEQSELETQQFRFTGEDGFYPKAVLLLFVSESAAAAVKRDLCHLDSKKDGALNTDKASPFILLTLKDPLEGVKGALFRSVLDIECLNATGMDNHNSYEDTLTPALSLHESLALIRRSGWDSHLLSMLGIKSTDNESSLIEGQDISQPEKAKAPVLEVQLQDESQEESVEELQKEPEKAETMEPSVTVTETPETPGTPMSPETPVTPAEPVTETPKTPAEPDTETPETPPEPDTETPETPPEPDTETPETPPEPDTETPETPPEPDTETPETPPEPDAETAEIPPEPAAEIAEIPAEPVTETPAEQVTETPETPPEPATETPAEPATETPAEPATETILKTIEDQKKDEPHPIEQKQKEEPGPVYTLAHRRVQSSYSVLLCKPDSHWTKYKHQGLPRRLIQFPPPPLKGGITVTMEDLQCLDNGQFLNDVIIDFYLKYLLQKTSAAVAERSHIFSSFFYKQLTRRDNASEGNNSEACHRQRRHQRVKTWTRHVDIFKKDFLFVPVNQESHWYLVVICFPGLDKPIYEDPRGQRCNMETGESLQAEEETQGWTNSTDAAESPHTLTHSDAGDSQSAKEESNKDVIPGPVDCTELTCQRGTVCKRPCILIMDSLKLSLHERVFKLLREYLQSEWEVRRGSQREFGPDQMTSSHCRVPLQDNSSDCGLYLLQYVECFLKDPVSHFELPLCLEQWFPRQQVRRKREQIRDLILYLYRHQNLENQHLEMLLH